MNRHYVSVHYWPNKDAGGAKLQEMYHKLIDVHKKAAVAKAASNGD
jgi:chromodomain-helicase-DNA-binding protein 1